MAEARSSWTRRCSIRLVVHKARSCPRAASLANAGANVLRMRAFPAAPRPARRRRFQDAFWACRANSFALACASRRDRHRHNLTCCVQAHSRCDERRLPIADCVSRLSSPRALQAWAGAAQRGAGRMNVTNSTRRRFGYPWPPRYRLNRRSNPLGDGPAAVAPHAGIRRRAVARTPSRQRVMQFAINAIQQQPCLPIPRH